MRSTRACLQARAGDQPCRLAEDHGGAPRTAGRESRGIGRPLAPSSARRRASRPVHLSMKSLSDTRGCRKARASSARARCRAASSAPEHSQQASAAWWWRSWTSASRLAQKTRPDQHAIGSERERRGEPAPVGACRRQRAGACPGWTSASRSATPHEGRRRRGAWPWPPACPLRDDDGSTGVERLPDMAEAGHWQISGTPARADLAGEGSGVAEGQHHRARPARQRLAEQMRRCASAQVMKSQPRRRCRPPRIAVPGQPAPP